MTARLEPSPSRRYFRAGLRSSFRHPPWPRKSMRGGSSFCRPGLPPRPEPGRRARRSNSSQELSDMGGKVDRLGSVKARIAGGQPVAVEIAERRRAASAKTFGDIQRAHFEVDSAAMDAFGPGYFKESVCFGKNVRKAPDL